MAEESAPLTFTSRPIRFITNDGKPYAKRRRINTACNTCRRRKTRCSGEKPSCETCKESNQTCTGYGPASGARTSPTKDVEGFEDQRKSRDGRDASSRSASQSHPTSHDTSTSPLIKPSSSQSAFDASASWKEPQPAPVVDESQPSIEETFATLSIRNRMPYFRYFGPTAIMPGFKQMVVKVQDKQRGSNATSSLGERSPPALGASFNQENTSPRPDEPPMPCEPPSYDSSEVAPNPLITHLCETFFAHLACNYTFLQKDRFMRDLQEKQVDPILVDAVCALAARFSNHPLLTGKSANSKLEVPPPERGQLFAQRAKAAIPDTFPCPSVAIVQAALLLAYDEFGANRDSGLWMYLGIAIRMAQDLGMQKLEGLKYVGRGSLTPQNITYTRKKRMRTEPVPVAEPKVEIPDDETTKELIAIEQERVDTLWAVFHLDRYISSGTGRPVALRDEDIEIAFPPLDEVDPETGWPKPWPALIRIVHLYGSVAEILNGIKEISHLTPEVIERLMIMESNLTDLYQGLSPKLHFNAANFQHYVQNGQGTNFVMLHFWFHTLIIILHQPTLLHTFDEEMQELFPRSRELSLSSAKTIADILAFTEIMSSQSTVGSPFTSQPTYVAACAFLKESALHAMNSACNSRAPSPPSSSTNGTSSKESDPPRRASLRSGNGAPLDQQAQAKHTLLAASAQQNYQRCYRALQQLEHYWAGTKYIITILDQKSKGVWDALLYTQEESEHALEMPRPEPAFTSPGWRRKLSWGAYLQASHSEKSGRAIGWSLTGTMNSPKSANLSVLYSGDASSSTVSKDLQPGTEQVRPFQKPMALASGAFEGPASLHAHQTKTGSATGIEGASDQPNINQLIHFSFPFTSHEFSDPFHNIDLNQEQSLLHNNETSSEIGHHATQQHSQHADSLGGTMGMDIGTMPYGNMMIESQNIDMSMLGTDDMMWLDYLPTDFGMDGFADASRSGK
ncbi:uncharacterized protein PV09_03998 [Verruconis gallopava]|uniref:Zn(2)-C6 fungal-type domain-containing protein n=1 Tax=Verruconis gallopava TaxID=253628 RepID=A0A0D2AD10_9PEZI|nr:uncharacterized protein PV09_03998 [Verruconis gallopava]KIW04813.1 hypothetical protein PV09_03998 [Verruconis gallopava]